MTSLRMAGVEVPQCQELKLERQTEATKGSNAIRTRRTWVYNEKE